MGGSFSFRYDSQAGPPKVTGEQRSERGEGRSPMAI